MKFKKVVLASLVIGALSLVSPIMAMADGQSVVSLGVDLSEEQRNAILRYFGIEGQNIPIIWVNNQQERDLLSSYVPIEQIGTHTYSCAYIQPTASGGIQVRTANMNWVTSNMIATTLSTAGVVNCNVVAVAPFEMSGTGALTGILLAYETSYGQQLDPTRKEIATQELITTGTVSDILGKDVGTELVNDIKLQIIQGCVTDEGEVITIVDDTIGKLDSNSALSPVERQLLYDLAYQIAQQRYDYDEVKETLERVEQNVGSTVINNDNSVTNNNTTTNEYTTTNEITDNSVTTNDNSTTTNDNSSTTNIDNSLHDSNNIINTVDPSALGDNVITDSTQDGQNTGEQGTFDGSGQETPINPENPVDPTNPGGSPVDVSTQDTTNTDGQVTAAVEPDVTPILVDTPQDTQQVNNPQVDQTTIDPTTQDISQVDPTTQDTAQVDPTAQNPVDNTIVAADNLSDTEADIDNTSDVEVVFADSCTAGYVRFFINGDNTTPQSGKVSVINTANGMATEVDLSDMNRWVASVMSDADKASLGWTEGTEIIAFTGEDPIIGNKTVSVSGTFINGNGESVNVNASEDCAWTGYSVGLKISSRDELVSGNILKGSIVSDGSMSYGSLAMTDGAVASVDKDTVDMSSEDTSFSVNLTSAGRTTLKVVCYGSTGDYLGEVALFVGAMG